MSENEEPGHAASVSGDSRAELTGFLNALGRGDLQAGETLMPLVYEELHRIAQGCLGQQSARTLQATALIHEAYLKLFAPAREDWNDRRHFFALAARAMRQVLVDDARRRRRLKRGEGRGLRTLDEAFVGAGGLQFDTLDLDRALTELSGLDERQARVVELRWFGGLEVDQVAELLAVSRSTVEREWRSARAWLGSRLRGSS